MRVKWDGIGERFFEAGADRGVLYEYIELEYKNGVAWNGLTSASVSPSGSSAFDGKLYHHDVKSDIVQGYNEYNVKISCYTYPDAFEKCIGYQDAFPGMAGSQQERSMFGFSYRTKIGNDVDGLALGYKIHLIYNCLVVTDENEYRTVSENLEATEMSYDAETFPVETELFDRPLSEIVFDSRRLTAEQLAILEDTLYGTEETEPRMPYPDELAEMLMNTIEDLRLFPAEDLIPDEELIPR